MNAAIDAGDVHVEERLVPRRDGRSYARRFLVVGPAQALPVERMTAQDLVRAREGACLSQVALARRLGLSESTVNKWEQKGHVPPGQVHAVRQALGLSKP